MASQPQSSSSTMMMPNGAGAAAVLAAGTACCAMGVLSVLEDKFPALARLLIIYRPTGPLSGLSTVVIVVWVAVWAVLHSYWKRRNIDLGGVVPLSLVLLAAGVLLTFPPIGDLF
jgi:hypothetical protein